MRNRRRLQWAQGGSEPEPETSFSFSSIQPGTLNQVTLLFKIDPGYEVTVNYGDGLGAQSILADGHDQTFNSAYSTINTTYTITVAGHLGHLRKFQIGSGNTGNLGSEVTVCNLNINDFAAQGVGLTQLLIGQIGVTGNTGSINNLPSTLLLCNIHVTSTTITGSPALTPGNIINLELVSSITNSEITGSLPTNTSHPDLFRLRLTRPKNTFAGTINTLPAKLRISYFESVATGLTGSLDTFFANCLEMVDMYWFVIGTAVTGTSAAIPLAEVDEGGNGMPRRLKAMTLQGSPGASYTLNLNNFSGVDGLHWSTLGTGNTGSIESLAKLGNSTLFISGCGTNINYGGGAVPNWALATLQLNIGFTTANLDAFIIAAAATPQGAGTRTWDFAEPTNQARSAASNAAVVTLAAVGKTVTSN